MIILQENPDPIRIRESIWIKTQIFPDYMRPKGKTKNRR